MEEQETGYTPKMKECPWCGEKESFILPDLQANYVLMGYKGNLSELKAMNPIDFQKNMTELAVIPITCKKCGYTILLNKAWLRRS